MRKKIFMGIFFASMLTLLGCGNFSQDEMIYSANVISFDEIHVDNLAVPKVEANDSQEILSSEMEVVDVVGESDTSDEVLTSEEPVVVLEDRNSSRDLLVGNYTQEEAETIGLENVFLVSTWCNEDYDTESGFLYFTSEEFFLQRCGFSEEWTKPFYEYYNEDGELQLVLYYDKTTDFLCGVNKITGDGFIISTIRESEFTGFRVDDYSIPQDSNGNSPSDTWVDDYTEDIQYDSEGRITQFRTEGVYEVEREPERGMVLQIDYAYHENGELAYREYVHSSYAYGSYVSVRSWFDEAGRPAFESSYITHGHIEDYYIYTDDSDVPAFRLNLDRAHGGWGIMFYEYVGVE